MDRHYSVKLSYSATKSTFKSKIRVRTKAKVKK